MTTPKPTPNPTTGGRWHRDPKTGKLTRPKPAKPATEADSGADTKGDAK